MQTAKKGCSTEEILAVLTHELGHWKFSHNLKNICIVEVCPYMGVPSIRELCLPPSQVNLFVTLFVFGYFLNQPDVYTSFGFSAMPTIIGLFIVFELIFTPYNMVCAAHLSPPP